MITKMKVKIKRDFDGKVSTSICHKLNELCGQKWKIAEIKEILNLTGKSYLNEIGRKSMVNGSKVNYVSANYLLVAPKQFITSTGEQIYVWLYRKSTDESFGKINIGADDDFDYAVVKNHFAKTKKLNNQILN